MNRECAAILDSAGQFITAAMLTQALGDGGVDGEWSSPRTNRILSKERRRQAVMEGGREGGSQMEQIDNDGETVSFFVSALSRNHCRGACARRRSHGGAGSRHCIAQLCGGAFITLQAGCVLPSLDYLVAVARTRAG
jgi:hypothetical protein